MSTLLAGPWVGEFGWLVAIWAPVVRHKARKYDKVIVVCPPQYNYLFADFAKNFIPCSLSKKADMWKNGKKKVKISKEILAAHKSADIIVPNQYNMLCRPRKYYQYGKLKPGSHYDLVIHARSTTKYGQSSRNWPVENYTALIEHLGLNRVCSIGTDAHHIPGTDDKRNLPLEDLCDIMRSSRLMIGPSSGPCHLAQACKLPLIVWTYDKVEKAIKASNRKRYEHLWKPFDAPVKVIDDQGWHPKVKTVLEAVREYL